ncbi:MAG: transcription antitermination factor NusB [Candidatus Aminicenantes bacterium]|nr:transcription antitermination factor NusB [Candidatus Aminicenantes bacterium]
MGRRRNAREAALQILYELEFNEAGPEAVLLRKKKENLADADGTNYSAWLVTGVSGRRGEIDGLIQGAAKNWRVARMGLIDRNILRLAVYEMLEEKTLVPAIIINEAVDIARRYSGDESAVFVNGVLDAVRRVRFGGTGDKSKSEKDDHDRSQKPKPSPQPVGSARGAGNRSPRSRGRAPKK